MLLLNKQRRRIVAAAEKEEMLKSTRHPTTRSGKEKLHIFNSSSLTDQHCHQCPTVISSVLPDKNWVSGGKRQRFWWQSFVLENLAKSCTRVCVGTKLADWQTDETDGEVLCIIEILHYNCAKSLNAELSLSVAKFLVKLCPGTR